MVFYSRNLNNVTFLLLILVTYMNVMNTQPLPGCLEDEQCAEGHFCQTEVHVCRECLRCHDLKREPLPNISVQCIRSAGSCGGCVKGFVNIYKSNVKGKCVLPLFLEGRPMHLYMRMIALGLGLLIVIIIALAIKNIWLIIIMFRIEITC